MEIIKNIGKYPFFKFGDQWWFIFTKYQYFFSLMMVRHLQSWARNPISAKLHSFHLEIHIHLKIHLEIHFLNWKSTFKLRISERCIAMISWYWNCYIRCSRLPLMLAFLFFISLNDNGDFDTTQYIIGSKLASSQQPCLLWGQWQLNYKRKLVMTLTTMMIMIMIMMIITSSFVFFCPLRQLRAMRKVFVERS